MTQALAIADSYADYRLECLNKVLTAERTYNVPWQDKDVLDRGRYDGAIIQGYLNYGPRSIVGIDDDEPAVLKALQRFSDERLQFRVSSIDAFPLDDSCVDTILSFDLFELKNSSHLISGLYSHRTCLCQNRSVKDSQRAKPLQEHSRAIRSRRATAAAGSQPAHLKSC